MFKLQNIVKWFATRNQGSLPAPTDDFWYGPATRGAPAVGGNAALTFSGAWAATNTIAGLFGQLPCKAYRRVEGGREEATAHRVHRIIGREPNPEMDSFTFWEMMSQWWTNYGNGFAEKQRLEDSGRLHALWPIHPSRVRPDRTLDGTWTGYWLVRSNIGGDTRIHSDEMFNIVGALSDDGITGKGVLSYAAQSVGIAIAENKYKGGFYEHGGRPSGTLEHPSKLSPGARDEMRREWREVHAGNNELAILWEGMKYNPIGVDPERAKLGDSQIFSIQEACRFWDVPPHVLYELSKGTFSNTEEMNRFLVSQSFGKRLARTERAMDRQLFTEEEKLAGYYTKFNVDALLRGNPKEQAEIDSILIGCGVSNQDEARARREWNKIPNGAGSHYFVRRDHAPLEFVLEHAEEAGSTPLPSPETPSTPAVPGQNGYANRLLLPNGNGKH